MSNYEVLCGEGRRKQEFDLTQSVQKDLVWDVSASPVCH